jgi:translation initiation factor 1A
MPKKQAKGTRSDANTGGSIRANFPWRETDDQLYARVTRILGNGRVMAQCGDGSERLAKVRGSMRCRDWVRAGDTVLVSLRPDASGKADILFKYNAAETAYLKRQSELDGLDEKDDSFEAVDDDVDFESDADVDAV